MGLALAIALFGAILAGVAYHYLFRVFHYLFFSEILGGLMVGFPLYLGVRVGRIRSSLATFGLAAVCASLMFLTWRVANSQELRPTMVQVFAMQYAMDSGASPKAATAYVEHKLTPLRTFQIYMNAAIKSGVTLSGQYSSGTGGTRIAGMAYLALMVGEWLIFAFVALGIGATQATAPFCENCIRWMNTGRVLRTDPGQAAAVLNLAHERRWDDLLARKPVGKVDDTCKCDVNVSSCRTCQSGAIKIDAQFGKQQQQLGVFVLPDGAAGYLKSTVSPLKPPVSGTPAA